MDSPQAHTSQPRELPPLPPGVRPRPISGGFRSSSSSSSAILTHRRPPSIYGQPPSPGSSSRRPPPPARPIRQTSDIILPPWQPDSSVSNCPICHSGFTFFNRRHHCRKCGRVVCHSCSPHRITIPKAFVVQPPPSSSCYQPPVPPVSHSTGSSSSVTRTDNRALWNPDDGGLLRRQSNSGDEDDGLQVRMCDECLGPYNRTQSGRPAPHPHHPNFPIPRNAYMNYSNQSSPPPHYNSLPSRRPPHNYYPVPNRRGDLPHFQPQQPRLKETDYCPICTLALPPIRSNGSEEDREAHIQNCIRQVEHSISPGPTSVGSAPSRVGSAPSRPGEMRARRYTGGGRMVVWKATEKDTWVSVGDDEVTPSSTPVPKPTMDPAPKAPKALKVKVDEGEGGEQEGEVVASSGEVAGETSVETVGETSGETSRETAGETSGEASVEAARETAKETAGEGRGEIEREAIGASNEKMVKKQVKREKAECVICFEEFEVGELIARLECLCRYHKKCIRAWFDRKGNGECPVHAVHD